MSKASMLKHRPLAYYREEIKYFKGMKNTKSAKRNYKKYKSLGGKTSYKKI